MSGPSNLELFQFLGEQLSFSVFRRTPDTLISFKETIEFVYVPEGTADGPVEGLLYEGRASLTHDEWCEFVAAFALLEVDSSRERDGGPSRFFRAREIDGTPTLASSTAIQAAVPAGNGAHREELHGERAHYVWSGNRKGAGVVEVHQRRIACRGADSGNSARVLFVEKLRLYRKLHG